MEDIRILNGEQEILQAYKEFGNTFPKKFIAFYHGGLNAIITDTRLMCIHFFDKQVHRGYAIFDTLNLINNKLYLFDQHMSRFFNSIRLAKLRPAKTKNEIKKIFFKIAMNSGEKDLSFRYWCSRGGKDLDITTKESEPTIFYCIAIKGQAVTLPKGMSDAYTTSTEVKGKYLAQMKTTNYLLNCLAADEAAKKGGLGVMVTEDGYVTEGSVQGIACVLKDKSFYAPPYIRALRSITLDRVLYLVEKYLVSAGIVTGITRGKMKLGDLKEQVEEMMLMASERIVPVKSWDGVEISKEIGPVTEKILKLFEDDLQNPEVTIDVPTTKI